MPEDEQVHLIEKQVTVAKLYHMRNRAKHTERHFAEHSDYSSASKWKYIAEGISMCIVNIENEAE